MLINSGAIKREKQ